MHNQQQRTGVIIRVDTSRSRVTMLDEIHGKIRAICIQSTSPGAVVRYTIRIGHAMPFVSIGELMAMPLLLGGQDITWFHMILSLVDGMVPEGSGVGDVYRLIAWLCITEPTMDNESQMRYCAKLLVTLGLHAKKSILCVQCITLLHAASVESLPDLQLDSTCIYRMPLWIQQCIQEHATVGVVPAMQQMRN